MTKKTTNLQEKSDAELKEWLARYEVGSVEHFDGMQELMRRNDAPGRKRELIFMTVAVLSLAVAISAIVFLY